MRETKTYTIKNRTEHDRMVLVEHPSASDFKLDHAGEARRDGPATSIASRSRSRPGKSGKQDVVEERDVVADGGAHQHRRQHHPHLPEQRGDQPGREGGAGQVRRAARPSWRRSQRDLAHANKQLTDITADQARLRANLREMPPTADAYKRYLEKFDEQETEIEQLRESIKQLQDKELAQRQAFDEYLANLTIE